MNFPVFPLVKTHGLMLAVATALNGCAWLAEDARDPLDAYDQIRLSFSDGSTGSCNLKNDLTVAEGVTIPGTASVRRSYQAIKYDCTTEDGRKANGRIPSAFDSKVFTSAVFEDFGLTDVVTNYHREYPVSVSIVVPSP